MEVEMCNLILTTIRRRRN